MKIKWIQLDLARQMMTVQAIEHFIGLTAETGYNGILMYLEDRVRTASYPYPADGECYTEDQMRHLISFAAERGIELIPCVATLGHAERFLRHNELKSLSEIRGDMRDRFGDSKQDVFCPSNPDFYSFIEKYIREIAALFPSAYFHAGLDEFFSFCICPECKTAAQDFDGENAMFAKHIKKIHAILSSLGKRMVMWSDMFEIYKDALRQIPNDILMIDWQYQSDTRFYLSHLLDCEVENRAAVYKELGIECAVAPSDMQLSNTLSCMKFARQYETCIGFVQTGWEKSDAYLFRFLPVYAAAGFCLNGQSEDEAFRSMMRMLFKTDDPDLYSALRLVYTNGLWRHFESVSAQKLFTRDFYGMPYNVQEIDISGYELLKRLSSKVNADPGKLILQDLLSALNEKTVSHKLKRLYHDALDGLPLDSAGIKALHEEYLQIIGELSERWKTYRSGIFPNVFEEKIPQLRKQLAGQLDSLQNNAFMKLRICLPDGYGVQHIRIMLRHSGKWTEIADSIFKPCDLNTALAEIFIPCPKEMLDSDAVALESYGVGGAGICWLELGKKQPAAIASVKGFVEHPEYLLDNDVKFAWFGSQSSRGDYTESARMSVKHAVILDLK